MAGYQMTISNENITTVGVLRQEISKKEGGSGHITKRGKILDNADRIEYDDDEPYIYVRRNDKQLLLDWNLEYAKGNVEPYDWSMESRDWEGCEFDDGGNLTEFECYDRFITKLPDLSTCLSLEYLNCAKNELKELPDLSKCTKLKYLDCYDNMLTELPDLSKCHSLKE